MPNTILLHSGAPPLAAPVPPCLPGRVLVRRVHGFVPAAFFASAARKRGWRHRLRHRYPRSIRKTLSYLATEGPSQTWAKIRSRVDLERFDAAYGAFAAVGVVVQDASGSLPPGTTVLCWSWHGPIDADFHMVAPEQCIRVPRLCSAYARAPFLGWIASLLKTIPDGVASCTLTGLDADLRAPLETLIGSDEARGRHVIVAYGSSPASPAADAVVVVLSADRAVTPLVESHAHGLVAKLPDASHYFIDPYFPGSLELPAPFGRAAVEAALAVLVADGVSVDSADVPHAAPVSTMMRHARGRQADVPVSCLGAGNYVRAVLLHHLRRHVPITVRGVMDVRPEVAARQASALDADFCTTDAAAILDDRETAVVLIASDHASHARYAMAALRAGKTVHLEKPPAVTREDLDALVHLLRHGNSPRLHLGYNRPYAPAIVELQRHMDGLRGPTFTTCTVQGYG